MTLNEMTVEHLGQEATEDDLKRFLQAAKWVWDNGRLNEAESIEYVWNNGDFYSRLTELGL